MTQTEYPTAQNPVVIDAERLSRNVKQAWLTALRSGEYTQAQKALREASDADTEQPFSFCCLGVLCDLSGMGTWVGDAYKTFIDQDDAILPNSLARAFGLETAGDLGRFLLQEQDGTAAHAYYDHTGLASLNDAGLSFSQIADVIEYFL